MSLIKDKGSLLERNFESGMKKAGIKYRKHIKDLPGKPDFAFPKNKIVVFIDSCFWHGCRYHGTLPKTNKKFWKEKICRNKERDKEINREYAKMGWSTVRLWEHKLGKSANRSLDTIIENLNLMLK